MSASQPANFNLQEFSDAGLLLFGGRLYTYAHGTTAQKTAYTDSAGAVPHSYTADGTGAQYIALNARGELPAPLYLAPGAYDVALKRADGSTVWTRRADPTGDVGVSMLSELAAPTGAGLLGWIRNAVGAVKRLVADKLAETISVKDFGAVGDGVADDTAAIQAALNFAAVGNQGGAVYLPKGVYKITAALIVPLRVSIYGAGGMSSRIECYDCDGLTFPDTGFDMDVVYFEDFGLTGMSGGNRDAILSPQGTGVKFSLHFSRLLIWEFNRGIVLNNNLYCSIDRCRIQYTNQPIVLGPKSTLTSVFGNTIVCAGGSSRLATADKVGINVVGGLDCEAIKIYGNFIYGFDEGIRVATVLDLHIGNNGIDACAVYGIKFLAAQHAFNVVDNFIELVGNPGRAVAGIYGQPTGSGEFISLVNIERNSITVMGVAPAASIGILLNAPGEAFQWHGRIIGNIVTFQTKYDIQIYNPGEMIIEQNRCISNLATSVWIGAVYKAPVHIGKNWLFGALYLDYPGDVNSGKIILDHNTTDNTFVPYQGSFVPTYTPAAGAFGAITYGLNSGQFNRIGDQCFFSLEIYTTAAPLGTASGLLYIDLSGIPFTPRTGVAQPVCPIGDNRLWAAGKGPSVAAVAAGGVKKLVLYARATTQGDNVRLNAVDLAATNPGNLVTISGSFLCA